MILLAAGRLVWERPETWPFALVLALASGLWVLRTYAAPIGLRHSSRKITLALIRLLAILLLILIIPAPAWKRAGSVSDTGGLTVLLDTSLSMGVVDIQRGVADRLRLAEALGRWSRPQSPDFQLFQDATARLGQLQEAVDEVTQARRQADAIELTRRDPRPARAKLLDSRRTIAMLVKSFTAGPRFPEGAKTAIADLRDSDETGTTSWQSHALASLADARATLERAETAALTHLAESDPAASAVASATGALSRLDIARTILSNKDGILASLPPGTPIRYFAFDRATRSLDHNQLAALTPDGTGTDIASAILRATEDTARLPKAVLLLTDGREVDSRVPTDSLALGGVPIFAINAATDAPPPGVRIQSVEVPDALVVDTGAGPLAKVRVTLRADALTARAAVRLQAAGQTQVREVTIAPSEISTVEFDLRADHPGDLPIDVTVDPVSGEAPAPDAHLRRIVRIAADRPRIVFVTPPPPAQERSWDAQLLLATLRDIPWLRVTEVRADEGLASSLTGADAIILPDLRAGELDLDARSEIRDAVARRGATLLLLTGPRGCPTTWTDDPALAYFLPGAGGNWRTSPAADGSVVAVPSPAASDFGSAPDFAARAALFRFYSLSAPKTPATVLLADRDSNDPLLTDLPLGAGHLLFLATDQVWRWNVGGIAGATNFWITLARRLVERPFPAIAGEWALDVTQTPRQLSVRVRHLDSPTSLKPPPPSLSLIREGTPVRTVPTREYAPSRYRAVLTDLPEGEYDIRLASTPVPHLAALVGDGGAAELSQLAGDRAPLEALTRDTAGQLLRAEQLNDLAALRTRLRDLTAIAPDPVTHRIWDSAPLLAVIISLLALEWALRKHWGLQ